VDGPIKKEDYQINDNPLSPMKNETKLRVD